MGRQLVTFLLFFVQISVVKAQDKFYSHPIDAQLEECRAASENQSAEGSIQCEYTARIAWEKEVTKYYGLLYKAVHPAEQKQIKKAQLDWIVYRDSEMAFAGLLYKNMKTDAWLVIHSVRLTNIIRSRALELQEYYEMATFDPE